MMVVVLYEGGEPRPEGGEPRPDGGNGEQEIKAKAVIAVAVAVKAREESKKQLAPAIKPLKYKL